MKWKREFPRSLRALMKQEPQNPRSNRFVGPGKAEGDERKIALQLTIRGDIIDLCAHPDLGQSFAIEEIAKGFDPGNISLVLDDLTPNSPLIWLAAVEEKDVILRVDISGVEEADEKTFRTTIGGYSIVALRALFDSAQISMTSGCSLDLHLLEGSGPIRVYRQVRRYRHLLH